MTQFLKRFLAQFVGFFSIRRAAQTKANLSGETVTRFVVSSGHYRKKEQVAKSAAFMPETHPATGVLETSVFRIFDLTAEEIWSLGRGQISQTRTIYCRADLRVDDVVAHTPLNVVAEPSTHPLHATIVKWPLEKDEQKILALELERLAATVPF